MHTVALWLTLLYCGLTFRTHCFNGFPGVLNIVLAVRAGCLKVSGNGHKGTLRQGRATDGEHWEWSQARGIHWAGTLTLQGVNPLKYHMGAEAAIALYEGNQAQTDGMWA